MRVTNDLSSTPTQRRVTNDLSSTPTQRRVTSDLSSTPTQRRVTSGIPLVTSKITGIRHKPLVSTITSARRPERRARQTPSLSPRSRQSMRRRHQRNVVDTNLKARHQRSVVDTNLNTRHQPYTAGDQQDHWYPPQTTGVHDHHQHRGTLDSTSYRWNTTSRGSSKAIRTIASNRSCRGVGNSETLNQPTSVDSSSPTYGSPDTQLARNPWSR
ncbi:hypothetical protein SAMN02745244_02738 [Tessaracoccus bendigoensis DSM 12906]|uniref:Uncharacterized protein n=1 Tax=Tessaracoccus bendigoensis DSM 12906 TaxID=1123357 RepID=A0A1M6K4W2_9ACTN|nr:hypothetical protein SAMN02745244_02738 [Tessaracoccus bendigoensis DSM 12906]